MNDENKSEISSLKIKLQTSQNEVVSLNAKYAPIEKSNLTLQDQVANLQIELSLKDKRIKDLEQLLKETTKQIKDDNFAITTLKEQYQNKEIEKKLLNEKFEKVMNRLDSLEKEIIEKDYRNEILSKKLEQRIMSTAEDYKQKTLSMLVKQDSMRNSLSNSFRIQGENSASRLNRILINEHPEYLEFNAPESTHRRSEKYESNPHTNRSFDDIVVSKHNKNKSSPNFSKNLSKE